MKTSERGFLKRLRSSSLHLKNLKSTTMHQASNIVNIEYNISLFKLVQAETW